MATDNPTWYGNIKAFFSQMDIGCMQSPPQGGPAFNLGSYAFVKSHVDQIYQVTASGLMPKGGPSWSADKVETFRNWMANDCPEGTPTQPAMLAQASRPATRIRKDIMTLSDDEIQKLKTAFEGIMARGVDDEQGYYKLAGNHWLPGPNFWCMHHDPGFLPWHRAYQIVFEDALRSVPGCGDVTLPYFDVTMNQELPSWLYEAPFGSYTIPKDVGQRYPNYTTQRDPAATVFRNYQTQVVPHAQHAMDATTWETFNGYFANADHDTLIAAHDNGHNNLGLTMKNQDVTAFDPIFWFFHNNWDRMWWEWQKKNHATTQEGLLSKISGDHASYQTFSDEVVAGIAPFTDMSNNRMTSITMINLNDWDIDYAPSRSGAPIQPEMLSTFVGSKNLHAAKTFKLATKLLHVRVDGVRSAKIRGTYTLKLMKGVQVLGTASHFQPTNASQCENCLKHPLAHFDFKLPESLLQGGALKVSITDADGEDVPLASAGSPTIEVRVPMVQMLE